MPALGPQPHQIGSLVLGLGGGNPPVNLVLPSISISGSGVAGPGNTAILDPGKWIAKKPFIFTYTWLRDGAVISGQLSDTYLITSADIGKKITVEVRYADSGGLTVKSTLPTATVVALEPFFSPDYTSGAQLSASNRTCAIVNSTGSSWVVTSPPAGKRWAIGMRFETMPTNAFNFGIRGRFPSSQTDPISPGNNTDPFAFMWYTSNSRIGFFTRNRGYNELSSEVGVPSVGDVWTIAYDTNTGIVDLYNSENPPRNVASVNIGIGVAYPGYKDNLNCRISLVTPYLPGGYEIWPGN